MAKENELNKLKNVEQMQQNRKDRKTKKKQNTGCTNIKIREVEKKDETICKISHIVAERDRKEDKMNEIAAFVTHRRVILNSKAQLERLFVTTPDKDTSERSANSNKKYYRIPKYGIRRKQTNDTDKTIKSLTKIKHLTDIRKYITATMNINGTERQLNVDTGFSLRNITTGQKNKKI